jgi:hypothetical protein
MSQLILTATGARGGAASDLDGSKQQALPGWSLADLAQTHSNTVFKEDPHMQDMLMALLSEVAASVGCDGFLMDTHSGSSQLSQPSARPDCTMLASPATIPAWPSVVLTFEFKLGEAESDEAEAIGQLVQRAAAALDAQPLRTHILGVFVSMNALEASYGKRGVGGEGGGWV